MGSGIPNKRNYKQNIVLFEGIQDMTPVHIRLPDPPPVNKIAGYFLPKEKQMWHRTPLPHNFKKLPKEDREKFIAQEWKRRREGYFFFNNGEIIYITGIHYFYLNWNKIDIGYPRYRNTDAEFFYHWNKAEQDDKCYGLIELTRRRQGKSFRLGCIALEYSSGHNNANSGFQSKTYTDVKKLLQKTVVQPWRKLPYFFQPAFDNSTFPKTELRFFAPSERGKEGRSNINIELQELESLIDCQPSTDVAYDGQKLHFYGADEIGKCFAIDTPILMHDGSVKAIQDIVIGESVMGENSKPRKVKQLGRGRQTMYDIIPTKGKGFTCNEDHILSLRWCSKRPFSGWKKNQIINISVKKYLTLSTNVQNHLVGWRVGVEYKKNQHAIDPYLLGAWLGDGLSSSPVITAIEPEIINYFQNYCDANNLILRREKSKRENSVNWHITTGKVGSTKNKLFNDLRAKNLIKNKHIPEDYIIDSLNNRLELLAGIIDTDGYRPLGERMVYEVVQKNKLLAQTINKVANSCGFYSSINKKIATMKREDGSIYSCPVYRVFIYGDLHLIPCKVERKKYTERKVHNKNRRNPLRFGFTIIKKEVGDYYGIVLGKNKLFLLGDYTVVHNTEEVSVAERWDVVKKCLEDEDRIIGKTLQTSTVEEMEKKGGKNMKIIWDDSDISELMENGQTRSGVWRHFLPAYRGYKYDEYGNSMEEESKIKLQQVRDSHANDSRKLASEKRKNPFTIREAFRTDAKDCNFNSEIIQNRLEEFHLGNKFKVEGIFRWKDNEVDGEVEWVPTPKGQGRFFMSKVLEEKHANLWNIEKGVRVPGNDTRFVAGGDPFKLNKPKGTRRSNGSGAVFWMHDSSVDQPGKPMEEWESNRFVCTYEFRPRTKELYGEDMIMMCKYWGCKISPEINVDFLMDHFEKRGYGGYLYYKRDKKTGKKEANAGDTTNLALQEEIYREVESYIELHGMRECHDELLQQWLDIEDKMTDFDLFVAAGYALMAAKGRISVTKTKPTDVKNYLRKYKYQQ